MDRSTERAFFPALLRLNNIHSSSLLICELLNYLTLYVFYPNTVPDIKYKQAIPFITEKPVIIRKPDQISSLTGSAPGLYSLRLEENLHGIQILI